MGARTMRSPERGLPYYDASRTPSWPSSAGAIRRSHVVGDFRLTDQDGRTVSRRDVAGKAYVAAFFYAQCRTLCPDVRVQLSRVHEAFATDSMVRILSHTVMPETDGPRRLADYAARNRVDGDQWRLLTGSRAELERVARDAYFVELSDSSGATQGTLRHTETLVLVDGEGHLRGMYDGSLAYDVTQLITDVASLRSEMIASGALRESRLPMAHRAAQLAAKQ
jgi:protein SCO1/2